MALTGFAISWGIFLLIVLLSMANGVVNGFEKQVENGDFNTITIYGGITSQPYNGLQEGREIGLKERDKDKITNQNQKYITSSSYERSGNATISTGKDYISDGYIGAFPESRKNRGLNIVEGRFINPLDIQERRKVIVLGEKNAGILFGDEKSVGKTVTLNQLQFTVIGVHSHRWNRNSYIPYTTATMMAGGNDTVANIVSDLRNVTSLEQGEEAERGIRQTMAQSHQFNPEDNGAIWVQNSFLDMLRMTEATSSLQMALWVIGILTLLSGIVGVSNIMFVSVRERTHEIGVRRALGARPFAILKQIILESVAITVLFGYIGIVAGVGLSALIGKILEGNEWINNPTVGLNVCLEVTVVLVVAGCLSGLFPALKALKVKPVEALRDE